MKLDKLGLAPGDLLGLVADARPDRIDLVEPVRGLELLLGHGCLHADGSHVYHRWGRGLSPSRAAAGIRVNDRTQQDS